MATLTCVCPEMRANDKWDRNKISPRCCAEDHNEPIVPVHSSRYVPDKGPHEGQKAALDGESCRPYDGQERVCLILDIDELTRLGKKLGHDLWGEQGSRVQVEEIAYVVQEAGGSAQASSCKNKECIV